jgi:hypothetical protein
MCATREPTTPLVWPPTVLLLDSSIGLSPLYSGFQNIKIFKKKNRFFSPAWGRSIPRARVAHPPARPRDRPHTVYGIHASRKSSLGPTVAAYGTHRGSHLLLVFATTIEISHIFWKKKQRSDASSSFRSHERLFQITPDHHRTSFFTDLQHGTRF